MKNKKNYLKLMNKFYMCFKTDLINFIEEFKIYALS